LHKPNKFGVSELHGIFRHKLDTKCDRQDSRHKRLQKHKQNPTDSGNLNMVKSLHPIQRSNHGSCSRGTYSFAIVLSHSEHVLYVKIIHNELFLLFYQLTVADANNLQGTKWHINQYFHLFQIQF
jgi:hypothetical protein